MWPCSCTHWATPGSRSTPPPGRSWRLGLRCASERVMFEHLRRLATTGAAYTAASVLSKLIALVLLPIYTAYLSPAEYGDVEIMIATLVAASIVVRLGVIEAI